MRSAGRVLSGAAEVLRSNPVQANALKRTHKSFAKVWTSANFNEAVNPNSLADQKALQDTVIAFGIKGSPSAVRQITAIRQHPGASGAPPASSVEILQAPNVKSISSPAAGS
jgi:hypothetical protein